MSQTMPVLLRVDSSCRVDGSHSRVLGDYAEGLWRASNPDGRVITRDLADGKIDILSGQTVAAFRIPAEDLSPEQAETLRTSEALIAELKSADMLLLTAPMYNFSVSSALKAWIDHVSRNGHTFRFDKGAYRGLLKAARAVVVCTYGTAEFQEGRQFATRDFLQPYLQFLLNSLGIPSVEFAAAHGTTTDPATLQQLYAGVRATLDSLMAGAETQP